MAGGFGTDILIRADDPLDAASFYVTELGLTITGNEPEMVSLRGENINLFIELGPSLGPVLEVNVDDVESAKPRLTVRVATSSKTNPTFPGAPSKILTE